nr:MAG TPA: hypothetical protein [Caudoviricetes sp.]
MLPAVAIFITSFLRGYFVLHYPMDKFFDFGRKLFVFLVSLPFAILWT